MQNLTLLTKLKGTTKLNFAKKLQIQQNQNDEGFIYSV